MGDKALVNINGLRSLAATAKNIGREDIFLEIALEWAQNASDEVLRLTTELAALKAQEPVAWMNPDTGFAPDAFIWTRDERCHPEYKVPVFASPVPPAPAQAEETMTLQEVWNAMGGNPGISPSRSDVLLQLKLLDQICDEADAPAQKEQS